MKRTINHLTIAAFAAIGIASALPVLAQTAVAPPPVKPVDIASKPLEDLNLRKEKTEPVLEDALNNPYAIRGGGRCSALNQEVAKLNQALGPDIGETESPSEDQKRGRAIAGTARSVVGGLIPFNGLVRLITGANAAANHRAVYLYAGSVRRAFLKGYAKARGCRIKRMVAPS